MIGGELVDEWGKKERGGTEHEAEEPIVEQPLWAMTGQRCVKNAQRESERKRENTRAEEESQQISLCLHSPLLRYF